MEGAMKLGKRTAKLVREAAVAGFVQGTRWAGWSPARGEPDPFPMDPEIWVMARRCAEKFPDLYPVLAKVEDEEYDAARAASQAEVAAWLRRRMEPLGGPTC
jgi:hypothetical protein